MKMKRLQIGVLAILLMFSFAPPVTAGGADGSEGLVARGISAINEHRYEEALRTLQQALDRSPENAEAAFYAGIAAEGLGDLAGAEKFFLEALRIDGTAVSAYLELIRIYYRTGRCGKAKEIYRRHIDLSQDRALIRDAEALLARCNGKAATRPYRLSLLVGGQDDTNILLESSNPPSPADRRSDDRIVVQVGAGAQLLHKAGFDLDVDYTLYQSLHRDLTDYNILYQKITPEVSFHRFNRFIPSAGYSLEYSRFGGESYNRNHIGFGKVRIPEGTAHATELIYEYRDETYWDTEIFTDNAVRRGHRNSFGIKQIHRTDRNNCNLYLMVDHDRTDADYWDFNGYRIGGEGIYQMGRWVLDLGGEFRDRRYRGDFPLFHRNRHDRTQQYSLSLTYRLTESLGITASESYLINESNLDAATAPQAYDYKRNVAGIYIRWGIL